MAFNKAPSAWLANWSEDGTNITVPIATFTELTAAEADATTGDIRKILWAFLMEVYQSWADTATADRPDKMSVTRSSSLSADGKQMTTTFSCRFVTDILAQEVADEV